MAELDLFGPSFFATVAGVKTLAIYLLIAYAVSELVYAVVAKSGVWLKLAGKIMLTVVLACTVLNGLMFSQNIREIMLDVARHLGADLPTQPLNLTFELQQMAGNWTDISVLSNAFTALGLYFAAFYFIALHRWRN